LIPPGKDRGSTSARVFRIIADSSLDELKQLCGL